MRAKAWCGSGAAGRVAEGFTFGFFLAALGMVDVCGLADTRLRGHDRLLVLPLLLVGTLSGCSGGRVLLVSVGVLVDYGTSSSAKDVEDWTGVVVLCSHHSLSVRVIFLLIPCYRARRRFPPFVSSSHTKKYCSHSDALKVAHRII